MVEIIIAIVVLIFIALGFREGLVKALTSVAAVFASLMLATATINSIQLTQSRNLSTVILFLFVFTLAYIILDLILTLLFRKVISVTVLGPVDKVGGVIVGGFKGLLICGIVIQVLLYCPFQPDNLRQIKEAYLSRLAVAIYQWSYPYAKNIRPEVNDFIKSDYIGTDKTETVKTEDLTGQAGQTIKKLQKSQDEVMKLLEENKLVPGVPEK